MDSFITSKENHEFKICVCKGCPNTEKVQLKIIHEERSRLLCQKYANDLKCNGIAKELLEE